jgi:hypothetical protein
MRSLKKVNLDPSRLYQVDYLFAGKGEGIQSRWGHAMFRLVLCAPETPMGEACRQDVDQHVVVSFRAFVDDLELDMFKGLTGGYDSREFLLDFHNVVTEYTKYELREITSLPLDLTPAERTTFVDRVLELYWGHIGSYYFIGNNCASEAINLLRTIRAANEDLQEDKILSPLGLYDWLVEKKMIDESLLNSSLAQKNGYHYPSQKVRLLKLYKNLQSLLNQKPDWSIDVSDVDLEDYLFETTAAKRGTFIDEVLADDKSSSRAKNITALLQFEEQIWRTTKQKLMKSITSLLVDDGGEKYERYAKAYKEIFQEMLPEKRASNGYGIPLVNEYVPLTAEEAQKMADEVPSLMEEAQNMLKNDFSGEIEILTAIAKNRKVLLDALVGLY